VQIAPDLGPGGVGGGHDACRRGGLRGLTLGVCDSDGDQLGEGYEAPLDVRAGGGAPRNQCRYAPQRGLFQLQAGRLQRRLP
jgi:hypothetical protein